jgi:protein phosphatase-4 regulatory subunit 3
VLQSQAPLTLQQHLELSSDILSYLPEPVDGEPQPLIMAQAVPNPPTEKKRVKVYELRNNDWFDRGTGFCTATLFSVRLTCLESLSRALPTRCI